MIAVRYLMVRFLLLAGFIAVFYLLRVPPIWAVVFGALFSMVTSYFFQARDREAVARRIEERVETRLERRAQKAEGERTFEDEEDEEIGRSGAADR